MNLNEKIAARRRERERLNSSHPSKEETYPKSFSNTKNVVNTRKESNGEHPILGLMFLAGLIYITYLLIFDPDFAWWEFLLYLLGIGFLMNLFIPDEKQKTEISK